MATKRCACLTAVHYVSEQKERERERVERIKAARSLRRQTRMKPTLSRFLLQTIVDPLCVCVSLCVRMCLIEQVSLKFGVCVWVCVCVCNRDSTAVLTHLDLNSHLKCELNEES